MGLNLKCDEMPKQKGWEKTICCYLSVFGFFTEKDLEWYKAKVFNRVNLITMHL